MGISIKQLDSAWEFFDTTLKEMRGFMEDGELSEGERNLLMSVESAMATINAMLDERENGNDSETD